DALAPPGGRLELQKHQGVPRPQRLDHSVLDFGHLEDRLALGVDQAERVVLADRPGDDVPRLGKALGASLGELERAPWTGGIELEGDGAGLVVVGVRELPGADHRRGDLVLGVHAWRSDGPNQDDQQRAECESRHAVSVAWGTRANREKRRRDVMIAWAATGSLARA